jgi:diguanylate cyclase (GGDEF)-like protein
VIDSPEILRLIETAPLFRGISREVLDPLCQKARLVTLKPGERLLSPDVINEHVYLLISGRMSVQVTPSLLDEPITMLTSGECIGEMSVLVDGLVSSYVIASTSCELFVIDYLSFWSLIDGSSEAARNMLNILVQRIRLGNEVIADSLVHHHSHPGSDIIDYLTGLYNYHGMHGKFERLLQRCVIDQHPLCIIVLEVDELDKPRVSAGKVLGDQSLRTIAQTMLTFLRPDDHAARLIGNKFAVLLSNLSLANACATAERLRSAISQTPIVLPDGNELPPFTISAGVSEALPDDTWNTFIARADISLEQAIDAGRNRVVSV